MRRFVPILAALAVSLGGAVGRASAQDGPPPANVEVRSVERGAVQEEITLTATILPRRFANLSAAAEGQVEEVMFEAGDVLREGQPMVRIRTAPTQFQLDEARAQAQSAKAQLDELLNGTRAEDIEVSRAEVRDAEARRDLAKLEAERYQRLLGSNTVAQAEYDRADAELRRAEAEVSRAKADLARDLEGPRQEEIARARAAHEAAKARVGQLEDELDRHTIRAPFLSVAGNKGTEKGQWLSEGDVVARVSAIGELWAEANLPERYYPNVKVGSKAFVEVDALGRRVYQVPIAAKVPLADQASRSFPVRALLNNDDFQLATGMFARMRILLEPMDGEVANSLLVPKDAVVRTPDGSQQVWVAAGGDGQGMPAAEMRTIQTGRSFGDMVELVGPGLAEDDRVVTRGNEVLQPGQPLNILNQ
ncbi:MAG: efflux RND transporter periplasmic adaptor subunit [Sumerlaeia bacterium]